MPNVDVDVAVQHMELSGLSCSSVNVLILQHALTLLEFAVQEWRPMVDEAVQHFRDAGCAETDIRGALKNHYCVDELDLGPDPQPEQVSPLKETALCRPWHNAPASAYEALVSASYLA